LRKGAWFETRVKNALLTMTKFLAQFALGRHGNVDV